MTRGPSSLNYSRRWISGECTPMDMVIESACTPMDMVIEVRRVTVIISLIITPAQPQSSACTPMDMVIEVRRVTVIISLIITPAQPQSVHVFSLPALPWTW
ncbi:hypothetical protein J6590_030521 [Homalodisca vitripennis]|nr:hypothetical protein J6590_030521 [Homalodisca vitripennis]